MIGVPELKEGMERTQLGGTFRNAARRLRDEAAAAEARSSHLSEAHVQAELCCAGYLVVVAYLESVVNDAFLNAARRALHGPRIRVQQKMAEYWRNKARDYKLGRKGAGIVRRYNWPLRYTNAGRLQPVDPVYQNAQLLVTIRNALTHFVSEWQDPAEPDGMTKVLVDASWARTNPLRRPPGGPPEPEAPWFPRDVLCSDGLSWAIGAADALTEEWTRRLGLKSVWWRVD